MVKRDKKEEFINKVFIAFLILLIATFLALFICILFIQVNQGITDVSNSEKFCKANIPLWASTARLSYYDTEKVISQVPICIFENGDYRLNGYRKEIYYLIDGNTLGRQVKEEK